MRRSRGKKAHVLKCIISKGTKYFNGDSLVLRKSSAKRPLPSVFAALALFVLLGSVNVARAQWTPLTNAAPGFIDTCLVLTDGRVFCLEYGTNAWHFLTPDINGSYVNGTWSAAATMPNGTDGSGGCAPCTYAPVYFGSSVLADGQVVVVGGEYNTNGNTWTNIGFMYDPVANSWSSQLTVPFADGCVGDAQVIVIDDGTMLLADSICSTNIAAFDIPTLTFNGLNPTNKACSNNEENWNILPDGTVLTVDAHIVSQFEIYDPVANNWTSGAMPVNLADTGPGSGNSTEIGPGVLRPDGTLIYFSGNPFGQNAVYDTVSGIWTNTTAMDFPVINNQQYAVADGPASLLPNGNVLVMASPVTTSSPFNTPSHFFEFDGTNLVQVADSPNAASFKSYQGRMVLLPSGEVLLTAYNQVGIQDIMLYSNGGVPQDAWRPVITSGVSEVLAGETYSISGKLFNGFSEGATYGDDAASSTNYPLVRITIDATGHVFYARTYNHTSMGVELIDSDQVVTTQFDAPDDLEAGASELVVVVNGIASEPIQLVCPPLEAPAITIPSDVSFEDTCSGDSSLETLWVCNTGGDCGDAWVDDITSSDPQFSVTEPFPGYPITIGPNFCFPFEAVFTPSSPGAQSAAFSVVTNDPANPTILVQATGSGTEPDLTTIITDGGDFGDVCLGDTADLELVLHNSGDCDLSVNNITSDSALFQVADVVLFPVVIGPGSNVEVTLRFEPEALGPENATITIESDAGDQLVPVSGNTPPPNIVTLIAAGGDYGDVCLGDHADLDLIIGNSGDCDLAVDDITSNDADFQLAEVVSFPLVIGAGVSLPVPIRFEPSSLGPHIATIGINSDDPDTPYKKVAVSGNTPPGEIRVTGSTDFGDVCADELAEKVVAVCNVGECDLTVTDASIDCPDFTLINSPFPAIVSHDFCLDLVIRFTPTSAGPKECTLTITSDDPVTPEVTRTLTGNTPFASIGVPSDVSFAPTVVQDVDACETPEPFPVSNTGICSLEITEFAVVENMDEYFLDGLPSLPILLQPGHIAGAGDLDATFAPEIIGRDRLGELSITYISDPITGDTLTETRALCGEGVYTGARVLVTFEGQPLDEVKMIKLRRMNGNNNGGRTDTIETAKDVLLQTVTQDPPCASFQYHREYGTLSNPIQLVPGSYLVTVKASIPGVNGFQQMTVAFDVSSCDFNPTVIVGF